ncbi:hypothetical protein KM915_25010 [Cytobacillus oceanisediminis]|uniref:hypothetical protein n=1 Tax=Cytobacillus oceanisediminis TaxID=665099 RepID=UPI001C2280C3|nr:hypothetical protein [Cytobacillus oceanisediminis]MBU8733274.1 hypothetical protein [Cytobacillus oceanisediminis]
MKKALFLLLAIILLVTPSLTFASPLENSIAETSEEDTGLNGVYLVGDEYVEFTTTIENNIRTTIVDGETYYDVVVADENTGEIFLNGNKIEEDFFEPIVNNGMIQPFATDPGGAAGGGYTYVKTTTGSFSITTASAGSIAAILTAGVLRGAKYAAVIGIAASIGGAFSSPSTTISWNKYHYKHYSLGKMKWKVSFYRGSKYITTLTFYQP